MTTVPTDRGLASSEDPQKAGSTAHRPRSMGEWRIVTDVVATPIGVAWCPTDKDSCEQAYGVAPEGKLSQVKRSPDRQSLAFFALGDECDLFLCFEGSCGTPVDGRCNPNNGTLKWLPSGGVLYRGGVGSGVGLTTLYDREGAMSWTSLHVLEELSPSGRYLLVGKSPDENVFGEMERLEIVDLAAPRIVETLPLPSGADPKAAWMGDRLKLTWTGGDREIPLPDAGTVIPGDTEGRPFAP